MTRLILTLMLAIPFAAGCGGGGGDLNKDLKPIDPNAPRPTGVGGPAPGKGKTDQGPSLKPQAPPP